MANSRGDQIIGTSLEFEESQDDSISPTQRGRSPPRPTPIHHGSKAAARSAIESGGDFGPLSPDTEDHVYPIRSVVNISQPLQPSPISPNILWSPSGSVAGSIASGVPDEACVGLGIQGRSHSKSPRSSLGYGRRASVVFANISSERASRRGSVCVSSIVEGLSTSGGGEEPVEKKDEMDKKTVDDSGPVLESEGGGGGGSDEEGNCLGDDTEQGYMTTRFKHVITDDGHCVIAGVSGTESLQRCEDEPIHIPGAVQRFGVLIALEEDADGKLGVKIVSENSQVIMGYSPSALFALGSFCDILSEEQSENLYEHLEFVRDDTSELVHPGPEVFPLTITTPNSTNIKFWCAIHVSEGNQDLIVCELELEDDQLFPLFSAAEEPSTPEDTLDFNPSEQDLLESTMSISKPLRVLRHARKRKGQAAALEVFNLMSQIQEQLSSAPNLDTFLKVAVGVVKELTGFHRVMVYQFDENWNGQVVTELVDSRATKDLYKGLNFPASDIPKQARDLYKINKVRLLYDRDQQTARLVCKSREYLDRPLDMTHSYLRAMSPIHIKYLKNMAVRASMSISIIAFGELWGLVSCHTYGQKGMRVSFPIRKMCRIVGETMGRNVERLSYALRLQARKLINTVPTEQTPSGYIVASSEDLLKLFDADFGLLSIKDETKVFGRLEQSQEALALVEYLRVRNFTSVVTSQDLGLDFPDLSYAPGFFVISGLLLVPLSIEGDDFIVFFRKGQLRQVNWAGNPYEKILKQGTSGYLEPRRSFKIWSETVAGKCREWTEDQVETAAVLCLVYGKFIQVWRQKEATLRNSQLTKLLLANASHEVRTPLNAIINYLEIALESPLDPETRENLMRSHSASKSLIYVINDLLDLTRSEEGQNLIMDEIFDLSNTVREAISIFKSDTTRKGISLEVIESPGLPRLVKGDQSRFRQAISNIIGNAIKHTNTGGVRVEVLMSEEVDSQCRIEIVIQDTGEGISPPKLEMLFREFEQVQTVDESEKSSVHPRAVQTLDGLSKIPGQKMLGLGLAVVARTIRNMNGQLRLKSEEGKGSRFTISLPFMLPSEGEIVESGYKLLFRKEPPPEDSNKFPSITTSQIRPALPETIKKRNSSGSLKSLGSQSSGRSEIDRILYAIPGPHTNTGPNKSAVTVLKSSIQTKIPTPPKTGIVEQRSASPPSLTAPPRQPDKEVIEGSTVPLTAVRIQEIRSPPPSLSDIPVVQPSVEYLDYNEPVKGRPARLKVLVAEDDPINSKIIKKRMEKLGHEVSLTVNGAECADLFIKKGEDYDIVLMDMQMPIMDGGTSTTKIRDFESSNISRAAPIKHQTNGRVAIFVVSASLVEERCKEYMDLGFDGWILKPVDFKRLQTLMDGILYPSVREDAAYQPGAWERGGWFLGSPPKAAGILEEATVANPTDLKRKKESLNGL